MSYGDIIRHIVAHPQWEELPWCNECNCWISKRKEHSLLKHN